MNNNYLKVKALLKIENSEESILVEIVSTYKESFHYIGRILENSSIANLYKDDLVIARYDDNIREFYILGVIDEIIDDEENKQELTEELKWNLLLKDINNNFNNKEEFIMLKKYLLNNEPDLKDFQRQAIVISGKNLKYDYPELSEKYDLNEEEDEFCKKIGLPYDFKEELDDDEFFENLVIIEETLKNSKSREERRILNGIIDKIAPVVPEDEVKEIHLYNTDGKKTDCIFLDEAGVYEIVSKKARLHFDDGETIVGYVGSDFKIYGKDCICIFESYDKERGFYDYNYYLLDDLVLVEAIENDIPRYEENINFDFEF